MDTAVYLRQSQDKYGDNLAVDRQREECEKLCAAKDLEPARHYIDNDISASTGKRRPAYERLCSDIAAGRIGTVVVWDLDRLHRHPMELESFIGLADRHRIALATVTGDTDLSTDNGRLFARIKGAVAKAEVERKSARQMAAARQRAESGDAWWPSRPFGFTDNRASGLHKREAKLIQQAYANVLQGMSLRGAAIEWNRAGVLTPKANAWDGSALRKLLMNPRNAGLRTYRGEVIGEASWNPIVSKDIYDSVVTILSDPSRAVRTDPGRKYLLSSIAICGKCGATVSSGKTTSNQKTAYVCKKCFGITRTLEPLDKYVTDLVVEFLTTPEAAELLVDRQREDAKELAAEAEGLRQREKAIAGLLGSGQMSPEQFTIANGEIQKEMAAVDAKRVDADRARIFEGVIGPDARRKWKGLSLDRRRAIVNCLLRITILPVGHGAFRTEGVDIEWLTGQD